MEPTTAAVLGGLLGLVIGVGAVLGFRLFERSQRHDAPQTSEARLSSGIVEMLEAIRTPSIVVGPDDVVVRAAAKAHVYGLVRSDRVYPYDLAATVRKVRSDRGQRDIVIDQPTTNSDEGTRTVAVHIAPLSKGFVLLLAEDVTEARRLDAVRRDFVANVSHELKTPIGALSILAEAIMDASDDPETVNRFAQRMQHESTRLSGLVTELIDLSRLQDAGPVREPVSVPLDGVVAEAVDATRLNAQQRDITLTIGGQEGLKVYGDRTQLGTALRNLINNAISYSAEGTRVAVITKDAGDFVELSVTDQGVGIPEADVDRIFERFYRVDPARSRLTGGTGLGLSIVKHVMANHGGEVAVWSVEGAGSTFTLRIPRRISRSATLGTAVSGLPAPADTTSVSPTAPMTAERFQP